MQRLALLSLPLLLISTPAVSADLYGAPPRVVERERIIERYYERAPAYTERRAYVEEPEVYYEPRVHTYYDRPPYGYAYSDWRRRHFFPRAHHWHRHHHHRYHHHHHRHW